MFGSWVFSSYNNEVKALALEERVLLPPALRQTLIEEAFEALHVEEAPTRLEELQSG
jgi:hypothetical protein